VGVVNRGRRLWTAERASGGRSNGDGPWASIRPPNNHGEWRDYGAGLFDAKIKEVTTERDTDGVGNTGSDYTYAEGA
jgi:hypothetical protein